MSPKDLLPIHSGNSLSSPLGTKRLLSTLTTIILISLLLWRSVFPERTLDLLSQDFLRQGTSKHGPIVIPLIKARKGAVASQHKLCSDIGVDVLKYGGNAVDAAVSAVLCTGVVSMYS